jgi:hypothetical protein
LTTNFWWSDSELPPIRGIETAQQEFEGMALPLFAG